MCVCVCVRVSKEKGLPSSHGRSIDPCHVAEMLERSYDWRTRYVSPYLFDSWAGRSPSALATNPHERWHVKKTTILSCQHWELGRLPLAGDAGHFKMRMDNLDITARRDIPPGVPVIDDIWTRSTRHCRTGQLQGPTVPYVPVVGTSVGCSLCCRQKRPARSTL